MARYVVYTEPFYTCRAWPMASLLWLGTKYGRQNEVQGEAHPRKTSRKLHQFLDIPLTFQSTLQGVAHYYGVVIGRSMTDHNFDMNYEPGHELVKF